MLVVDTNLVAYLLLVGDRTEQARALWAADPDWRSDPFLLIEFCNVLATNVRIRGLPVETARTLQAEAERLTGSGLASVPHADALAVATRFSVSAYDARFLAVAARLRAKLVTEDARLRAAAPKLTQSMSEALAALGS